MSNKFEDHINKGRITIDEVKNINREKGYHFFDYDTMRFFNSRIERDALRFGQLIDDKYFITSEQFVPSHGRPDKRKYTVRKFYPNTGNVNTIGEFQEFLTKKQAKEFAWCLADHDENVEKCRMLIK